MGCTSSAPNMADVQTNATEDTKVNVNNETDESTKKKNIGNTNDNMNMDSQNNIEALPKCDNFAENIQLDSIKNSTEINPDTKSIAKDMEENVPLNSETQDNNTIKDEKITTFKDVADIVIVTKILEETHIEETNQLPIKDEFVNETINESEVVNTESCDPEIITTDVIEITEEDNRITEHESPTQSENRSTRWEALADIAAELPPSLAVDPVTGQIYSLSK